LKVSGSMKVLHVGAEVFPLVKTGGLADVLAALPAALETHGVESRMLLPGLPPIMDALGAVKLVAELGPAFGAGRVRLLKAQAKPLSSPLYVVDAPFLYQRPGGPYESSPGQDWPDNAQRFGLLGWVAAQLATGGVDLHWAPAVVHGHDWHAGLTFAYLQPWTAARKVATVFTVHNLAYQGLFALSDGPLLGLSDRFMQPAALEYHGQLSFMKAGLKFAQAITTVSPTYAREITTPEFGAGLDGVIRARARSVSGILNGIDTDLWNPAKDKHLTANFSADRLNGKVACKAALQQEFLLDATKEQPLLSLVSRLTHQKGLDLLLAAIPGLLSRGAQLVIQGSGDASLVSALQALAAQHPGRVGVHIGYDEPRAHRIFAGADVALVPSRFEPCGLTQLYGLRYGAVPLVRQVGGLADTVVDLDPLVQAGGMAATGFTFREASAASLGHALDRLWATWREPEQWQTLVQQGMRADFSWDGPAKQYRGLYDHCCASLA
jgi:starch synthase